MGDHQRGALGHQALQGVLHQALGFVVERSGGFIQDQDRRIAQDRAGDRQALALAAGEQRTVLTDRRLQLLRHARDELPRIGRFGRGADLRFGGLHAVGDVGAHGVIEQHDLLPDHRHLATQVRQRVIIQCHAVQRDAAAAGFVEARHQPDQAGLAAAGAADNRRHRARLGHETDVVQRDAGVFAVAQHHVFERELTPCTADPLEAFVALDRHVQNPEQALGRGHTA